MENQSADRRLSKEYLLMLKQEVTLMKNLRLAIKEGSPTSYIEKLNGDLQRLVHEKNQLIQSLKSEN